MLYQSMKDVESIYQLNNVTAWHFAETEPLWFHQFWTAEACPEQYRAPAEFAAKRISNKSTKQI